MSNFNVYKVSQLPTTGVPNSIYFLLNGSTVDIYLTTILGNFIPASNNQDTNAISKENGDIVTIKAGTPVMISNGKIIRTGSSNGIGGTCIGITAEDILPNFAGNILLTGTIFLEDWTTLIDDGGLLPGTKYYLSSVLGELSSTVPDILGNIHQYIGVALDENTLDINIGYPILL